MITKFKIYEELNAGEPEVGDWVIVNKKNYPTAFNPKKYDFVNSSIGYIWKKPAVNLYLVKYFDIPVDQEQHFLYTDGFNTGPIPHPMIGNSMQLSIGDIVYWSKNKEDLEHVIQAKKYNI